MYKIEVTTKSDTLFASSEGSAIIDSMTRHRKNGLPYIPGKTMKGLLKESAMEVSEILDVNNSANILEIFGNEGNQKGIINFDDFEYIKSDDWNEDIRKHHLPANSVLNYFTTIRHQTAIKNGFAKIGSLRTYKCLKQDQTFILYFDSELCDKHKFLLQRACQNLRRVGSNRNRGFGLIEVKFNVLDIDIDKKCSKNKNNVSSDKLKITLLSPSLLPSRSGDANIVASEKIISGRKILGMLAGQYIKSFSGDKSKVHEDINFQDLFLNGKVIFSDAYPVIGNDIILPNGQHWVTNKTKTEVFNEFESIAEENVKAYGGLINVDGNKKRNVSTILDFHNSRNKMNQFDESIHTRISGTNSGNGIYYYESLEADQEFAFTIEAKQEQLAEIYKLINNASDLRIGKSTSTALGKIKIENFDGSWPTNKSSESECILTFISPVVLKDHNGEYNPTLKAVEEYLGDNVTIISSRLKTCKVQVNQSNINMQFPEMLAIASGSSIMIRGLNKELLQSEVIGEFSHEGFGRFIIEAVKNDTKKDNLKNLMLKKDSKETVSDIKFDVNSSHELIKYVSIESEVKKAIKDGNSTTEQLHKNTTKRMIDLCREIQYQINITNDFKTAINNAIIVEIEKAPYSIKIIEQLIELFSLKNNGSKKNNKNADDSPEELNYEKLRKKDLPKFKKDFIREFTNAIEIKVEKYVSKEAKTAYLKAFFNKAKIENRNDSKSN